MLLILARLPRLTEGHRLLQIVGDCSTSQQSLVLVLSKVDPDHHDLEARLDAICRTLLGSDAMITIGN